MALDRLATPLGLRGKAPQITHLTVSASYLSALVEEAERGGRLPSDFGLESIGVGGEVLSEPLKERASAALGAKISTSYMMTETVPSGGTPCTEGHLHHTTEFGHLEILDPVTHTPTPPGDVGIIVQTPYVPYRDCTLLLRYATGDLVRLPGSTAECELAHLPATSPVLGRWTGPLSREITTWSVLNLLEAEPDIPLPARYALVDEAPGPRLHVLVRRLPAAGLLGRLEDRATAAGLALDAVVLHDDPAAMPRTGPVRADLRERTFELVRPAEVRAVSPA